MLIFLITLILLTVGRRSRPAYVLPQGDTNIGQFLKIERMSTAVSFTSRQVQPRTDISLGSGIFFQLRSYSTFATGQRETRDFHPPLNTFQVCIAGTRKILRFNFFPLKSVGKLQRFMPFSGGNPIPKIPLGYLLTSSCQIRCWSLTDSCFGFGRSSRDTLRPHKWLPLQRPYHLLTHHFTSPSVHHMSPRFLSR